MWCWFWHVLSKKLVNEAVKIRRKKVLFILDDIKYLFYFIINDHQVTSLCFTVFFGVHPALSLSGQLVTAGLVWRPSQRTTLGFSFCSETRRKETTRQEAAGRISLKKLWKISAHFCTFEARNRQKVSLKKQSLCLDRNSPNSASLISSLTFAFWISSMWSCRWLSWCFNISLYLIRSMFPFDSRLFSSSRALTSAGDIRVTLAEWLSSDLLQNSTGEKNDVRTARCSRFWVMTIFSEFLFLLSDYSHPWIRREMLRAECVMHSRPKPTPATQKTRDKTTGRHTQRTSCDDCVTCCYREAVLLPQCDKIWIIKRKISLSVCALIGTLQNLTEESKQNLSRTVFF